MDTFFDLYMKGQANIADLDVFLEEWHKNAFRQTVEDYLGLTKEQYALWCNAPDEFRKRLDLIKHLRNFPRGRGTLLRKNDSVNVKGK